MTPKQMIECFLPFFDTSFPSPLCSLQLKPKEATASNISWYSVFCSLLCPLVSRGWAVYWCSYRCALAITSQTVITENFTFHNTLNQDRHTHTDETKDRPHHVTVGLHLYHIIKPTIKHTHPDFWANSFNPTYKSYYTYSNIIALWNGQKCI